jgi:hypothetical protein
MFQLSREQFMEKHEEYRIKCEIYTKQCETEGSHHKLIYGSMIDIFMDVK